MPMTRMLYFSKRKPNPKFVLDEEVDQILTSCRANNQKNSVTGILLADRNHFLQLLEGRRVPLNETYQRILKSKKHSDVILCDFRSIEERSFQDFQMLYQPMEGVLSAMVKRMADPELGADVLAPDIMAALLGLYSQAEFQAVDVVGRDILAA